MLKGKEMENDDLENDICIAGVEVQRAKDGKMYRARKCRRLSTSIASIMEDIEDGVFCASDKRRATELLDQLKDHLNKLWLWDETLTTRQETLEDLRRSREVQHDGEQSDKAHSKSLNCEQ